MVFFLFSVLHGYIQQYFLAVIQHYGYRDDDAGCGKHDDGMILLATSHFADCLVY